MLRRACALPCHPAQRALLPSPCPPAPHGRARSSTSSRQAQAQSSAGPASPRKVRDEESVRDYLASQPLLLQRLGATVQASDVHIEELGTGLINHVFRLSGPVQDGRDGPAILLKYAPPYVKTSGLKLAQVRMCVEAEAMRTARTVCPQHVPELLAYDKERSVLVMQYIGHPATKVIDGLHTYGLTYPHLPRQVATLLVALMAHTREEAIGKDAYHRNVHDVFANTQIRTLNEQVVLTDPMNANYRPNYKPKSEDVARAIQAFREDPVVTHTLTDMVRTYQEDKHVLIHNDLHFGNLLACADTLHCIDWEFATYGPMSFDLGCLMAVQLMASITLAAKSHTQVVALPTDTAAQAVDRAAQQAWLLTSMEQTWTEFRSACHSHELTPKPTQHTSDPNEDPWAALYRDVVGFACFCMFRLTAGIHPYVGFKLITDAREADECRVRAVALARALLHGRASGSVCGPEDLLAVVRRYL